jgi:hypothetical protein
MRADGPCPGAFGPGNARFEQEPANPPAARRGLDPDPGQTRVVSPLVMPDDNRADGQLAFRRNEHMGILSKQKRLPDGALAPNSARQPFRKSPQGVRIGRTPLMQTGKSRKMGHGNNHRHACTLTSY